MVGEFTDGLDGLLAAALEASPEPVMLYDQHRVVFANAAARLMLAARTPEDVLGVGLEVFLTPDFADASDERRSYVIGHKLKFTNLPVKLRALDGRTLHLRVDVRPVMFEDMTIAMVTIAR